MTLVEVGRQGEGGAERDLHMPSRLKCVSPYETKVPHTSVYNPCRLVQPHPLSLVPASSIVTATCEFEFHIFTPTLNVVINRCEEQLEGWCQWRQWRKGGEGVKDDNKVRPQSTQFDSDSNSALWHVRKQQQRPSQRR